MYIRKLHTLHTMKRGNPGGAAWGPCRAEGQEWSRGCRKTEALFANPRRLLDLTQSQGQDLDSGEWGRSCWLCAPANTLGVGLVSGVQRGSPLLGVT